MNMKENIFELIEIVSSLGFEADFYNLEPIDSLSNDNFIVNDYCVLKLPHDERHKEISTISLEIEKEAIKNCISPKLLNYDKSEGYRLTTYLKNYQTIKLDNCSQITLKKLVDNIKLIHNFKIASKGLLNYYEDIESNLKNDHSYTNYIPRDKVDEFLSSFKPLYEKLSKESCPSHLDLLESNILVKDDDVKIIDFEYATNAFKYFDLVSLLSENKIAPETEEKIIDLYFEDDQEKQYFYTIYKTLVKALDLYWFSWALSRIYPESEKNDEFLNIAKDKAKSFLA